MVESICVTKKYRIFLLCDIGDLASHPPKRLVDFATYFGSDLYSQKIRTLLFSLVNTIVVGVHSLVFSKTLVWLLSITYQSLTITFTLKVNYFQIRQILPCSLLSLFAVFVNNMQPSWPGYFHEWIRQHPSILGECDKVLDSRFI